ncbi:MAG: DUF2490 domain-containing protein [Flavobacteriaceae bacterium]
MRNSILVFALLFSFFATAQELPERQKFEHTQFWTSVNSTSRLSSRWGIIGDFHIRRENFMKDPNFYFLRLGAAFWINDQFSLVGGAAALWLATSTDVGREYALERRTYQQVLWRAAIKKVTFLQRIRIEQRWHQVLDRTDGSVDRIRFSSRFRFLFSGAMQIFNNPKLPKLTISDEILFHVGNEIVYNAFDQNRLFLGFNQRISKNWTVDYGYMMVYQQRYSGFEYDLNHTIRLFFYFSPDLRKKVDEELPHYPVGGIE